MATRALNNAAAVDSSNDVGFAVRVVSVVLAIVPFLATGLLFLFAWHTSRRFGAWPTYARPDPKSANSALYITSGLAMMASLPSVAVLLFALPIVRRLRLDRIDVGLIVSSVAGLLLLFIVFSGNLGDWYVD